MERHVWDGKSQAKDDISKARQGRYSRRRYFGDVEGRRSDELRVAKRLRLTHFSIGKWDREYQPE